MAKLTIHQPAVHAKPQRTTEPELMPRQSAHHLSAKEAAHQDGDQRIGSHTEYERLEPTCKQFGQQWPRELASLSRPN